MPQWFVIQAKVREDKLARVMLEQAGIEIYQPHMEKIVTHARQRQLKRYPLFPGYLFAHFEAEEDVLHRVKWCRGVNRLLPDNNQLVPLEEGFIATLKDLENRGEGVIKKPVDFRPGDKIQIKSGPMKDVYGIFEAWGSDDERVRILVEMVNNQARVMMHPSLIEKA